MKLRVQKPKDNGMSTKKGPKSVLCLRRLYENGNPVHYKRTLGADVTNVPFSFLRRGHVMKSMGDLKEFL